MTEPLVRPTSGSQSVAELLEQLEAGQGAVIDELARLLGDIDVAEREAFLHRAEEILAGQPEGLVALGGALFQLSWPGCELAGGHMYVAALRADPRQSTAIDGLASALAFVHAYDDAEPLVAEALQLTDRALRVVAAWMSWLADHDRGGDVGPLARETVDRVLEQWEGGDDETAPDVFADAVAWLDDAERQSALDRASAALAGQPALLSSLGQALSGASWPRSGRAAVHAFVVALRADPRALTTTGTLALAIFHIEPDDEVEALMAEALDLSGRSPQLLVAWSTQLAEHGRPAEAAPLANEALDRLADALETGQYGISALVPRAFDLADEDRRSAVVQRIESVAADRPEQLVAFGDALLSDFQLHVGRVLGPASDLQTERRGQVAAGTFLSALRSDPQAEGAVDGLARALARIDDDADAERLVTEALVLVGRPPVLLAAWSEWLVVHDRAREAAEPAREALDRLIGQWGDGAAELFATTAAAVDAGEREGLLSRAESTLAAHPALLVELGIALFRKSWRGCEHAGAQVLVAALRGDPAAAGAVDGFAGTLPYIERYEDAEPLVTEALALTGRHPRLLDAWSRRLVNYDRLADAESLALEYARQAGAPLAVHAEIAARHLQRRHYLRAAQSLDRLEAVAPDDPRLLLARGKLLRERGQLQESIPVLERACASPDLADADRFEAISHAMLSFGELGRFQDADTFLDARDPALWGSHPYARFALPTLRIRVSIYASDRVGAARRLELAEFESPEAESWSIMAERLAVLSLQGKHRLLETEQAGYQALRDAANLLTRAVHRLPLRREAVARAEAEAAPAEVRCALHFEHGLELADLERYSEAIEAYKVAQALWTEPVAQESFWMYGPYAAHNIATAYESMGRYAEGMDQWRRVADQYDSHDDVEDPYLLWARSSAHFRLDHLPEAYDACLRGLDLDPESPALLERLTDIDRSWQANAARRRAERGDGTKQLDDSCRWRSREAARELHQLYQRRTESSQTAAHHAAYSDFLLGQSDDVKARKYALTAMQLDPDEPRHHLLLGRCHESQDEFRQAAACYTAALDRSPDDQDLHSRLGACHVELGKPDAAMSEFNTALDKAPAHVESLIGLADLHVDMGDATQDGSAYDTAIELYRDALAHHRDGSGSKFLSSTEKAAILYQRGYCKVRLYEAKPNVLRSRRLLKEALSDFSACLVVDPRHDKARRAKRKLTDKTSPFVLTARERYGPWMIVICTVFVFALAQVRYLQGDINETAHIALTFGSIALAIAGLFLPELLKLKVAGVELEKSPVEQQRQPASFDLSR